MMLRVLSIGGHVGNLQSIDRGCLISIVSDRLHEALEVLLKVGVESHDIICVIAVLRVEPLPEKVDVASVCLN